MAQDTLLKIEKRRYTKSSSFVMALVFTVLCGVAAISLATMINYFAKGHFIDSTQEILESEIRYIDAINFKNIPTDNNKNIYILLNRNGSFPSTMPYKINNMAEDIYILEDMKTKKKYGAKIHQYKDGTYVLVGYDISEISKDFKFMQLLGIISIFFVTIVIFIAFFISIFVVMGTNKIADTARQIMKTGDFSRRVAVGSRWDDLSNMAAVLNTLLDRVEVLMRGLRQVSDNIAHDLRTPLMRMRSHIEDLKKNDNSIGYNKLIEETDHIISTFNALLRISKIEYEKKKSYFINIQLDALLKDVIDFYEPLAEEKNISFTINIKPIVYYGDKDLLFQAYANIIDNAIKFTPEKGNITIALNKKEDKIFVSITDTGCGVLEEEKDKIFDRFYRADKSRSTAGIGLGLSLVAAVVDLHEGKIEVYNKYPGLEIVTII